MSRVRDHVEPVTLHPVSPSTLTTAERAAFLASLRAVTCLTSWRAAHSTPGAWQRALCVGRCRPCPVRCAP
jgi:hypothetical protein